MTAPSADAIARTTAEEILSGALPAGATLPPERALATRFGVGRPLIREALRTLAVMGLVETIPSRGTFVRAGDDPSAHRQGGMAVRRRGVTAQQLSEARILIETGSARYAAQRATAEDLVRLATALDRVDASEGLEHVADDLAFHLEIASAAHNPVIELMLESIAVPTASLMVRSVGDIDVMRQSQPFHRACLEAIGGHDPDAAAEAMRAHLTVAREMYGEDYERSVEDLASRRLARLGASAGLEELVDRVLVARATERRE